MEVKNIFVMFCHCVVYLLCKEIKMEIFLGGIFKKGGHFQKKSGYIRGRRGLSLQPGEGLAGGGV